MFTSVDKALVATVMGLLFIIEAWGGWNLGITEEWVLTILGILTPVLVWLVPNLGSGSPSA